MLSVKLAPEGLATGFHSKPKSTKLLKLPGPLSIVLSSSVLPPTGTVFSALRNRFHYATICSQAASSCKPQGGTFHFPEATVLLFHSLSDPTPLDFHAPPGPTISLPLGESSFFPLWLSSHVYQESLCTGMLLWQQS